MARIVEFIGPPGAGKSATYSRLCDRHAAANADRWLPLEQFLPKELAQQQSRRSLRQLIKRIALPRKYWGDQLIEAKEQARKNFEEKYPDVVDRQWQSVAARARQPNGIDTRWRMMSFVREINGLTELINQSSLPQMCVIEEGMMQILGHAIDRKSTRSAREQLLDLIAALELPVSCVYFQIDINTLTRRLSERAKVASGHIGVSRDQLRSICRSSVEAMEERANLLEETGHNVLTLNATNPILKNCDQINEWLAASQT